MITFENVTGMYKITNIHPGGQYIFEEGRPTDLSKIDMYYENRDNKVEIYKTDESFFVKFDSTASTEMDEGAPETTYTNPYTFEITGAKDVSIIYVANKYYHYSYYNAYVNYYLFAVLGKDDAMYFYTISIGYCIPESCFEGMISHDYLPHDGRSITVKEINGGVWLVSYDFKPQVDDYAFFMRIYPSENKEVEISKFKSKDIIFCLDNRIFLKNGMIDKSTGIFYCNDGDYAESSIWDKAYEVIPFLRGKKYGSEKYWIGYNDNDSSPYKKSIDEMKELFITADFNQYKPCITKGFVWDKHKDRELYTAQRMDEDSCLLCYDLMLPHIVMCPISVLGSSMLHSNFVKKCRSKYVYFVYYKNNYSCEDFSYFISEHCPIILTSCHTETKFKQRKDTTIIIKKVTQYEKDGINQLDDVVITIDDNRIIRNIITGYDFEKIYGFEKNAYLDKKFDDNFFFAVMYGVLVLRTYNNKFALFYENQILGEFDDIENIGLLGIYRVQLKDLPEAKLYFSCFTREIIPEEKFLEEFISKAKDF